MGKYYQSIYLDQYSDYQIGCDDKSESLFSLNHLKYKLNCQDKDYTN